MKPEAAPVASVIRTIQVSVPIEKAFEVFTKKMGTWWPASHHIAPKDFTEIVIEPHVGGRWFERDAQGAECDWVACWFGSRRSGW